MKSIKQHTVKWTCLLILIGLMACAPATQPATSPESVGTTAVSTKAPALNSITSTPEQVFSAESTDIKPSAASPPDKNQETDSHTDSRADLEKQDAVLVYEQEGGLKGIGPSALTFTLYADGLVTASDGRSWQVPPKEIVALTDSILALGFADFEASYIPKDTCCDRVTHTITLYHNDTAHQVAVLDSADAPAELYQTLDLIGEFLVSLPTS